MQQNIINKIKKDLSKIYFSRLLKFLTFLSKNSILVNVFILQKEKKFNFSSDIYKNANNISIKIKTKMILNTI